MAVNQGFVQKIEVNRGGQVSATLILTDGTTAVYTIQDLDADPERFNERLSKLGLLRDAMNRAEPVEIEHDTVNNSEEIERIVRITRDDISLTSALTQVEGIVLAVQVNAQTLIAAGLDSPDTATVTLLTPTFSTQTYTLNLQSPERLVAKAQLDILLNAQASGDTVQLMAQTSDNTIRSVAVGGSDAAFSGENTTIVSGFVETLGLIGGASGSGASADFATVTFTTAPEFTGPGNTIAATAFTPQLLCFLVHKASPAYDLFEAGLRDNVRMRVRYASPQVGGDQNNSSGAGSQSTNPPGAAAPKTSATGAVNNTGSNPRNPVQVALAVDLLAPLASASRPVWITISRDSLDCGPEGCGCVDGVPSSDLSVKTLRDLHIPYKAVWKGLGCFNHGVYRFQFNQPSGITLKVCCEKRCIYESDDKATSFGYACVQGDCEVVVELEDWTCDKDFQIDVYRIR
ncbi:MAG: hypothetical protein WB992_22015 [Bryobacteraceae bacterium]